MKRNLHRSIVRPSRTLFTCNIKIGNTQQIEHCLQVMIGQILSQRSGDLQIVPECAFVSQWRKSHIIGQIGYYACSIGERNEKLGQPLAASDVRLFEYDAEKMPLQWCFWQLLMGEMYRSRLEGRRKKNLRQAIKCFQLALRSYESLEHPQARRNWIQIQMVCGRTYVDLARLTEQSQSLYAKAQECYRCAESALKDESTPFLLARMQQDLSYTYLQRTYGERQVNLQQAITRGQSALRLLTCSLYPSAWADVHVNMAEAYQQATSYANLRELYSGQSAMQEQAIRHIDAALQVYTPYSYPLEWARAQYALGVIYSDRSVGKRSENLGRARDCLEAAQCVFRPGFSPLEWSAIQRHLMVLR